MKKITPETVIIDKAKSAQDFNELAELMREYAQAIGVDLSFQDFERELETLQVQYQPPSGCGLLARQSDQLAGCAAIRQLEEGVAELKRMYVRNEFKGIGLGQRLLNHSLDEAKQLGFKKIRLDTLPSMEAAIGLYTKNGFYEIPEYRYNPIEGTRYLERTLN